MSEYKRLTERHENGYIELMCDSCKYNDKCDVETHYCNEAVKNYLAELEDKIENGTLKEVEVVKPNCIIYKEKLFVDFICQKCNSIVSFVEAGMLWLLDKSDLSEAKRIETIEQLYPNYCSCCGVKLKENH